MLARAPFVFLQDEKGKLSRHLHGKNIRLDDLQLILRDKHYNSSQVATDD